MPSIPLLTQPKDRDLLTALKKAMLTIGVIGINANRETTPNKSFSLLSNCFFRTSNSPETLPESSGLAVCSHHLETVSEGPDTLEASPGVSMRLYDYFGIVISVL